MASHAGYLDEFGATVSPVTVSHWQERLRQSQPAELEHKRYIIDMLIGSSSEQQRQIAINTLRLWSTFLPDVSLPTNTMSFEN